MSPDDIQQDILARHDGVIAVEAWGETSLFYNPGLVFKRGTYFATLKSKDGENDKASQLDRVGVFRLNMGLPKPDYTDLFGPPPARPSKGGVIAYAADFQAQDLLMPHPVYGWMGWVCVLNPTPETYAACHPLILAAHAKAKAGFDKRLKKVPA